MGVFVLSEDSGMPAANWVFVHLLNVAKKRLPSDSEISPLIDDYFLGYKSLILEQTSVNGKLEFYNVVLYVLGECKIDGPDAFKNQEFLDAFVRKLTEMAELLKADLGELAR